MLQVISAGNKNIAIPRLSKTFKTLGQAETKFGFQLAESPWNQPYFLKCFCYYMLEATFLSYYMLEATTC